MTEARWGKLHVAPSQIISVFKEISFLPELLHGKCRNDQKGVFFKVSTTGK